MIGPNSAGKTTVFNLLSGFLSPDQGSVSMLNARGEWVSCKTPDAFAHQGLGRTFQIAKPFTGLTVLENIMLGAFIRTSSRDEAEQIALRVAEQTDLTRHLDTEARNLTVGGMKRLEVARALAIQPRILLLDEVMAGLNPTDIEKSIQMIRRIRDSGVSVLLIEHMMQATMALSDRIVVLNEGAVLVSGAPRDVVENPPSSRPIWARSIRMLKVSKLCSGYGKSQVLNGLDFEVRAGEIVTLIGANGAGRPPRSRRCAAWSRPPAARSSSRAAT